MGKKVRNFILKKESEEGREGGKEGRKEKERK